MTEVSYSFVISTFIKQLTGLELILVAFADLLSMLKTLCCFILFFGTCDICILFCDEYKVKKHIIMISEDHVTLKTDDAGNTDLITEIHYIVKYIKIGNQY